MNAPRRKSPLGGTCTWIAPILLLSVLAIGLVLVWLVPIRTFAIVGGCAYCTNAPPDHADAPPPCSGDEDDEDSECNPPSANDGPGGDSNPNGPPCDCGMVQWRVSQPFTSVWLQDTPLLYRRSDGKWTRLTLRYNHRAESLTNSIGGFGPKWSCNWVGLIENSGGTKITNHLASGGRAAFRVDGMPEYRSGRIVVLLPSQGGMIIGPTVP